MASSCCLKIKKKKEFFISNFLETFYRVNHDYFELKGYMVWECFDLNKPTWEADDDKKDGRSFYTYIFLHTGNS